MYDTGFDAVHDYADHESTQEDDDDGFGGSDANTETEVEEHCPGGPSYRTRQAPSLSRRTSTSGSVAPGIDLEDPG